MRLGILTINLSIYTKNKRYKVMDIKVRTRDITLVVNVYLDAYQIYK